MIGSRKLKTKDATALPKQLNFRDLHLFGSLSLKVSIQMHYSKVGCRLMRLPLALVRYKAVCQLLILPECC